MASEYVSACQDTAWHTVLPLPVAWHQPIPVEEARLLYLSTSEAFLSVACCTKRHRRFVQPGEEGAEGTGSPKYFLQIPKWGGIPGKMEANFDRGAQQKTKGNNHNEQQRKILTKKKL